MKAIASVLLIFVAMIGDAFSDVYFRALGHNSGGVNPHAWDVVTSILLGVGIMTFIVSIRRDDR